MSYANFSQTYFATVIGHHWRFGKFCEWHLVFLSTRFSLSSPAFHFL